MEFIKHHLDARPHWMNAVLLFCAYMTFIYLPWDLFVKPVSQDQEVWFGLLFTSWPAKIGGVLHWIVYGAGTWGLLRMKKWMHPWAAIYILQIAFSMLVYTWLSVESRGFLIGGVVSLLFVALAAAFWFKRNLFDN